MPVDILQWWGQKSKCISISYYQEVKEAMCLSRILEGFCFLPVLPTSFHLQSFTVGSFLIAFKASRDVRTCVSLTPKFKSFKISDRDLWESIQTSQFLKWQTSKICLIALRCDSSSLQGILPSKLIWRQLMSIFSCCTKVIP